MSWQKYDLVFRLQSPLHIGWRKTSNLMQTRPYVPAKNLWAALTARLTRGAGKGADGQAYVKIGAQVQECFRFSYLYPALKDGEEYKVYYPWESEAEFDYLFLDSYASTALNYESQSAEDGLLHDTEFIAPRTRTDEQVFLRGYLYLQQEGLPNELTSWETALGKLQLGGEQGYGWGRVELVTKCPEKAVVELVDKPESELVDSQKDSLKIITAHLLAQDVVGVNGVIEPLLGWERNNPNPNNQSEQGRQAKPQWKLSEEAQICYAPGSKVTEQGTSYIMESNHLLKKSQTHNTHP